MKNLLIYAHYNRREAMDAYVFHSLTQFRALGYEVLVASTSPIRDASVRARLDKLGCQLLLVENIGYDFYAWRSAILTYAGKLNQLNRLVLLNSSVHGPFFDLRRFLDELDARQADVLGATLSLEGKLHLQSYFYFFKPQVFRSASFMQFWQQLIPYADRQLTIDHHELGFTEHLTTAGFSVDAFHSGHDEQNPALKHPDLLYQKQLPFMKLCKLKKAKHLLLRARLHWCAWSLKIKL